jgi:hypothetical protein
MEVNSKGESGLPFIHYCCTISYWGSQSLYRINTRLYTFPSNVSLMNIYLHCPCYTLSRCNPRSKYDKYMHMSQARTVRVIALPDSVLSRLSPSYSYPHDPSPPAWISKIYPSITAPTADIPRLQRQVIKPKSILDRTLPLSSIPRHTIT